MKESLTREPMNDTTLNLESELRDDVLHFEVAGATAIGKVRDENQAILRFANCSTFSSSVKAVTPNSD